MSPETLTDLFTASVHAYMTRPGYRLRVHTDKRLFVFLHAGEDIDRRAECEYKRDGIAYNKKLLEQEKPKTDDETPTTVWNDLGHALPKGSWAWFLQSGERRDVIVLA